MDKNLEIILKPENEFEKYIIEFSKMIKEDKRNLIETIRNMEVSEKLLCKHTLTFLVNLINRELPVLEVYEDG